MSPTQCLTTAQRIRRVPRRVESLRDTLAQQSEIGDVRILDTTLRDGGRLPRASFSYEGKCDIIETLDGMGTHVIEAGSSVNLEAEFEAVADIAVSTDVATCGLTRVVGKDIEAALDSGIDMVHTFMSTSDVQLADSMHASREEAVGRTAHSVEHIRDVGVEVMFSPMGVTRTNEDFLIEVVEAVFEAGVDWINLPGTYDVAMPAHFARMVATVRKHTGARIDVYAHDGFGLASANVMAGFEADAAQAQVLVNSISECAGSTAHEEVAVAAESLYGVDTGIDMTKTTKLAHVVEVASDIPVPANKPVAGRNALPRESGIHAAGVIENVDTLESGIMTPEMVGATRELVFGKHTETHSVWKRLADIGFDPSDAKIQEVIHRVRDHGAEKEHVGDSTLGVSACDAGITHEDDTEGEAHARWRQAVALWSDRPAHV